MAGKETRQPVMQVSLTPLVDSAFDSMGIYCIIEEEHVMVGACGESDPTAS